MIAAGPGSAGFEPALLILGPLRLRGADGDVGLGGERPRRLLAALAAQAGEVVSADRLIDIVWGEAPPRWAKKNLHTYVWSLRRALRAAADDRLVLRSRPEGYTLSATPGALDWERFCEMRAAAARQPRSGPALLRQALGLWRGLPAADVADGMPLMAGRFAAMEEARMAALEQRIEADLAAGAERELIAELAELVAAHPLRERLRGYQMVALYRCGRRAEALSAFHKLRERLAEDLGVDPGPDLQALFEAMLRAGSAAEPAARLGLIERRAAGGRPHPGTGELALGGLAARAEDRGYEGRRAELGQLIRLLAAPDRLPRIVRLHGPAGIGKTAFCYALARRCRAKGWPAVIIDSRDFRHDAAALSEAIAAGLGGTWRPAGGLALLLVLDTFEEMADVERDLWEIVLPGIAGPVLVVLSGRQPAVVRASSGRWTSLVTDVELAGLPEAQASRLVRRHQVRDPDAVTKIVDFAGGNPLLLTVAAEHWRRAGGSDADLSRAVASSVIGEMTREAADPGVRDLLEAASLVRTFNQELLTVMTGRDVSAWFGALCGLSFVRVVAHGARVHDLVREAIAADLRWRAPRDWQVMRTRAYRYLSQVAGSLSGAGPWLGELLHLATASSAAARFYAQSARPLARIRQARDSDLARLTELCQVGVTRFGLPRRMRAAQFTADLAARPVIAVAADDTGMLTGFAYSIHLNRANWRAAARTRGPFFAALPGNELATIKATPATSYAAALVTGATHLPGYDHLGPALRQWLFAAVHAGTPATADFIAYHLLTADCPELPDIIAAGLQKRITDIDLGGCVVDEWVLRWEGGFADWIGKGIGIEAQTGPSPDEQG